MSDDFSETQILKYTSKRSIKIISFTIRMAQLNTSLTCSPDPILNWEMRYPVKVLGATRGKFYVAQFIDEWHIGFTGRELSLAGSVFDLRFDAMFNSPVRQPQYVLDILVQKIFDYWAFSTISLGPSIIMSNTNSGGFGFTSLFLNLRIKVGSSL